MSLRPPATPSPCVLAGERFSRFDLKYSTVSSRASGHGHRQALEEPAKMDEATTSVFASRNSEMPEETCIQQVASDLQALKTLYGLLHKSSADENLDETSINLLTKMIDDSTQQALVKQAKMLSGSMMSPELERNLSIRSVRQARDAEPRRSLRPPASPNRSLLAGERSSRLNLQYSTVSSRPGGQFHGQAPEEPAKIDKATASVFSSRNSEETGMQQVASELQALKTLYGLLHKGPADENLDETSRAVMMKMLDDATQQALLKQAKMLSGCSLMSPVLERKLSIQSNRRTSCAAEPRRSLRPLASPSPSLLAGKRSSRLNLQYSTVSSRASHRLAPEEPPLLACLGSYRSSASALPPRHRPSGEQRRSGLSVHRMSVAATSQHGTVIGSSRHGDRQDGMRHSSSRGDQSPSMEGSSRCRSVSRRGDQTPSLEGSSSRLSVSREMSLGRARLHGRGTPLHVAAASSLSSTRRSGRLDSGLSLSKVSRRGSERAGRGTAWQVAAASSKSTRRFGRLDSRSSLSKTMSRRGSVESSSRRGSVSREISLGQARLQDRGTARHVTAASSSSTRRSGRLDSRLSLSKVSRRGLERAGRGMARHAAAASSSSTRRFGRLDSRLSLSKVSRRGSERAGRGAARHVASASSSSTRHLGRLDSRSSLSKTGSRRGSERASRGVATPEQSYSSSKTAVTVRSRIKPGRDITKPYPRRAEEEEASEAEVNNRRRGRKGASVSSRARSGSRPRRALKRIDSGGMHISSSRRSSSGAAMSYPSTSPTALPESRSASAASYSPPPPVSRRGIAPPVYAPRMSRSMRQRRRCEILERRVGRLRMLKSKIAAVFHHRHDHHHHHHHHFGPGGGQEEGGPSSRGIGGEHDRRRSPWRYLGEMFQHGKRQDKKATASRAVVGTQAKRRGGGNMHALFDRMRQHLRGRKRATASVKMRKMAKKSRAQANKMHWWQQLGKRRGKAKVTGGRPRRRLI